MIIHEPRSTKGGLGYYDILSTNGGGSTATVVLSIESGTYHIELQKQQPIYGYVESIDDNRMQLDTIALVENVVDLQGCPTPFINKGSHRTPSASQEQSYLSYRLFLIMKIRAIDAKIGIIDLATMILTAHCRRGIRDQVWAWLD